MCRKYFVMVLENDRQVDLLMKVAANHRLHCLYKIGVYGRERQHELYLVGKKKDYKEFKKEIATLEDEE